MPCFVFKDIYKTDGSLLYSFEKAYSVPELLEKKIPTIIRAFRQADLQQSIWFGRTLEGLNFAEANLANSNFGRSRLYGVNFDRSNLQGASFKESFLVGVDFTDAILDGCIMQGAHLRNCVFQGRIINRTGLELGETALEILI